jgi:hypothetical protein
MSACMFTRRIARPVNRWATPLVRQGSVKGTRRIASNFIRNKSVGVMLCILKCPMGGRTMLVVSKKSKNPHGDHHTY